MCRSVESGLYKGTPVLIRAVRKILSSKEATRRKKCVLEISDKGIKMIDKSKGEVREREREAESTAEMSSLISCDAVLNRSKIPVPRGTSILLQFLVKIRPNLAKIHEDRTKTASQLINELTSDLPSLRQ